MNKLFLILLVCSLNACSNNPTPEQGAVVGGVTGAGVGAVVGNQYGSSLGGAAIGAAAGAATGAVVGSQTNDKQQVIDYQQEQLRLQQQQMYEQGKEVNQIKRQKYWDQRLQEHK